MASPAKFNQVGELKYCVHSILRFAPWIRHIYIVTDAQVPPIMQELVGTPYEDKVKLIDHSEIFEGYEQYLPTFNSRTIESVIWRIKGLAHNFIYFNDDCFLIRPVSYEDFFRDGKIVLRGVWEKQSSRRLLNYFRKIKVAPHTKAQENSARLIGLRDKFFRLRHIPHNLNKTCLENFFLKEPKLLKKNLSYTIRDDKQFWTISLACHLEIKANNVVFDNSLKNITIHPHRYSDDQIKAKLKDIDEIQGLSFICTQDMNYTTETARGIVFDWLHNKIL
jgi:hypothetical protein